MIELDKVGEETRVSIDGSESERFSRTKLAVYGEGELLVGEGIGYGKNSGFLGAFFGCEVCLEAKGFPIGVGERGEEKVGRIVGIQRSYEPPLFSECRFTVFVEDGERKCATFFDARAAEENVDARETVSIRDEGLRRARFVELYFFALLHREARVRKSPSFREIPKNEHCKEDDASQKNSFK